MKSSFNAALAAQSSDGKGAQNFTAATVIFVVINFCASFYCGKKATSDEIGKFMSKYFAKYWTELTNEEFSMQFYRAFRNGMAHQWSPPLSAIAMDFGSNQILSEDRGMLILNVPPFYKMVISGLQDFESDLDKDPKLRSKFDKRYKQIFKEDGEAIEKVKASRDLFKS